MELELTKTTNEVKIFSQKVDVIIKSFVKQGHICLKVKICKYATLLVLGKFSMFGIQDEKNRNQNTIFQLLFCLEYCRQLSGVKSS